MIQRLIICLVFISLISAAAGAQDTNLPVPFRFAYFEAGSYYLHSVISREYKRHLEYLSGDSLDFVFEPYGYRSAEWDREKCRVMARELAGLADIDMVLAVGPWVVEDLLDAGFDRPIIALYQFDAEAQGLVDKRGAPIAPNLTVNWQPNKIRHDIAVLQSLFPSRTIGLLYFQSGDEFDLVKEKVSLAAAAFGADIMAPHDTTAQGYFSHFASYNDLIGEVDAIYLPPMWGVKLDQLHQFFYSAGYDHLPTFSSEGLLLVEKGAAASGSIRSYKAQARFAAHKTTQIMTGHEPASLPTVIEEVGNICLNMATLRSLNISLPWAPVKDAIVIDAPPVDTIPRYTLERALAQALAEHPGLGAARQRYERALAEAKRAYCAFYPSIDAGLEAATADNGRRAALFNPVLNQRYYVDLTLEQTIFSYAALKNISVARKNRDIARQDRRQAELNMRHAVTAAYVTVLELEDRRELHKDVRNQYQELYELAVADYNMGVGDTSDIIIYEEQYLDAGIALIRTQTDLNIARIILNVLLNRPNHEDIVLDREEFSSEIMVRMVNKLEEYIRTEHLQRQFEEYLIAVALDSSTSMAVSGLTIARQKDLLAQHRGRYYPEIGVRARYSYGDEFDWNLHREDDSWTVGAFLQFPILRGFDRSRAGRSLKAGLEELQFARDSLRFAHVIEIRTVLGELLRDVTTLPPMFAARRAAHGNLELMAERYVSRQISAMELTTVKNNNTTREIGTTTEMYRFFMDYGRLLHTIGVGYMIHGSDRESTFYKRLEETLGLR